MAAHNAFPSDWLVPDWPAPAHVHALCTTRAAGVSAAPYDQLNLGDHVGDAPAAVQANRALLHGALADGGGRLARPVFLRQVHGIGVQALTAETPDGTTADACSADTAGVACTIMVADCLPVLFTDRQGTRVAAAHAGWRGLAGESGLGVLEVVVASFRAQTLMQKSPTAIDNAASEAQANRSSIAPDELMAWLGPCIGPTAFEVGAEVRDAFCAHAAQAARHFQPTGQGKFLADLAGLARQRLARAGVTLLYGNDSTPAWCTVSQPSRFFSHRRDTLALGGSGRFAACIWLGASGSGR